MVKNSQNQSDDDLKMGRVIDDFSSLPNQEDGIVRWGVLQSRVLVEVPSKNIHHGVGI